MARAKRLKPEFKALYQKGIDIIALNDEPLEMNVRIISEMISTSLIADMFDFNPLKVARDIKRIRVEGQKPKQKIDWAYMESYSRKNCPVCKVFRSYEGPICPGCKAIGFAVQADGRIKRSG